MANGESLFSIRGSNVFVSSKLRRAIDIWIAQQLEAEGISDYLTFTVSLADVRTRDDIRNVNTGEGTGTAGSRIKFPGASFQVYLMTSGAEATVRIGRRERDQLPLQEGKGFNGFNFDELIIENPAQPGATMKLIIIPRAFGLVGGD